MNIHPSRTMLAAAIPAALLGVLVACGGAETTEERLEEAREETAEEAVPAEEPEAVDLVERSEGTFELTLTGDLEGEPPGVAVCTREAGADELVVSMQTDPPGEVMYGLAVALDGADELDGDFEASGARRWGGPVAVTRGGAPAEGADAAIHLTFQGTYTGPTGGGEVEGTIHCPPLEGTPPAG